MSTAPSRDLQLSRRALSDRDPVDLARVGTGAAVDLATVTGLDSLRQALIQRLLVRRGELSLHPRYGSRLHELRGAPMNERTRRLARAYIHQALSADTRVRAVEQIVITLQRPSTLDARITVTLDRGATLTLVTQIHV